MTVFILCLDQLRASSRGNTYETSVIHRNGFKGYLDGLCHLEQVFSKLEFYVKRPNFGKRVLIL